MGLVIDLLIHKLLILNGSEYFLQFSVHLLHILHSLRTRIADYTFACELKMHTKERILDDAIMNT